MFIAWEAADRDVHDQPGIDLLEFLSQRGARETDQFLLQVAIFEKNFEAAKIFLTGVDDITSFLLEPILEWAIAAKEVEIVKFLLENGMDVNKQGSEYKQIRPTIRGTPLHIAVYLGPELACGRKLAEDHWKRMGTRQQEVQGSDKMHQEGPDKGEVS